MKPSIKQDLLKIIVDKLLIGLLLGGAVYFFEKALTTYKEEQNFIFQLNNQRIKKMGEVWEKTYIIEDEVNSRMEVLKAEREKSEAVKLFTDISKQKLEIDSLGMALKKDLVKNRFWLKPEDYDVLVNYAETLINIERIIDQKGLDEYENERIKVTENVLDIQKKILNEKR